MSNDSPTTEWDKMLDNMREAFGESWRKMSQALEDAAAEANRRYEEAKAQERPPEHRMRRATSTDRWERVDWTEVFLQQRTLDKLPGFGPVFGVRWSEGELWYITNYNAKIAKVHDREIGWDGSNTVPVLKRSYEPPT